MREATVLLDGIFQKGDLILLDFSTIDEISNGRLRNDCKDLKFYDKELKNSFDFYFEGGCNSTHTRFWVSPTVSTQSRYFKIVYDFEGYEYDENRNEITFDGHFIFPIDDVGCGRSFQELSSTNPDIQGKYIRVGTFGNVGGESEHQHLFEGTTTTNDQRQCVQGHQGDSFSSFSHDHSFSFSTETHLNNPPYYEMNFCRSSSGTLDILPNNTVFVTDKSDITYSYSSITKFSPLEDRLLKGISPSASSPSAGGVTTHDHDIDGMNSHAPPSSTILSATSGSSLTDEKDYYLSSSGSHQHSFYGVSNEVNDLFPPFQTIYFLHTTEDMNDIPSSIGVFTDDPNVPLGWELINNNGVDEEVFLKGETGTALETGGTKSHSHDVSFTVDYTSLYYQRKSVRNTYDSGTCENDGPLIANFTHSHELDNLQTGTSEHIPSYFDMYVIKRKNEDTYTSVKNFDFDEAADLEEFFCKEILYSDNDVCNKKGICLVPNFCLCNVTSYYGSECKEEIDIYAPTYKTEKEFLSTSSASESSYYLIVPYSAPLDVFQENPQGDDMAERFNCSIMFASNALFGTKQCYWTTKSITVTKELVVIDPPMNLKQTQLKLLSIPSKKITIYLSNEIVDESNVLVTLFLIVLLIFLIGGFIMCICVCLCLLTICFLMIPIYFLIYRQKNKLGKIAQIEDIDLVLEENKVESDSSVAHIRINKELFEINYNALELKDKIGEGGSESLVFKVDWKGRACAFKVFKTRDICQNQSRFDEFEREVSILGSISHPCILSFYGASLKPPRIGILMEFCENGDLKSFLTKYQEKHEYKFPLKEKLRWLTEISCAMSFLHYKKIIHRDLKPENVLLTGQLETKVMDFGLSKVVQDITAEKTKRIGTSWYMAPEIVRGDNYDYRCDIYSYAILAWEVVHGNFKPFGEVNYQIEFKVANDPNFRPPIKTEVLQEKENFWLRNLFVSGWSADPANRLSFEEITTKLNVKWAGMKSPPSIPNKSYKRMIKDNDQANFEILSKENRGLLKQNRELERKEKELRKRIEEIMKKQKEYQQNNKEGSTFVETPPSNSFVNEEEKLL